MSGYRGSHMLPDGSCCHCGPANLEAGPRWACDCYVDEYETRKGETMGEAVTRAAVAVFDSLPDTEHTDYCPVDGRFTYWSGEYCMVCGHLWGAVDEYETREGRDGE